MCVRACVRARLFVRVFSFVWNIDDIPSKTEPPIKITKGVLITCPLHINYKENQCQTNSAAYLSTVYSLCNPFSFEKLCFVTRYYLESYVLQPDIIWKVMFYSKRISPYITCSKLSNKNTFEFYIVVLKESIFYFLNVILNHFWCYFTPK